MTIAAAKSVIHSGFKDPVFDSQAVFRTILSCQGYPGRTFSLDRTVDGPRPFSVATAAVCLTLLDFETTLWLDKQGRGDDIIDWLSFHCCAPLTKDHRKTQYAIVVDPSTMPSICEFSPGEVESPEFGATLIVQVPSFADGPRTQWSGPGIRETVQPRIAGLPGQFWADWEKNREIYPRGVDVFFTSGSSIVGLPRSVHVEV
ncbi:phosphonate C-P lyase system protein PhnH [Bradyrhizobium sp. CCBAU 53421]|uniref:phosphonate C-P lyase system protein PhnH n=1 Tax=Bradyrhizobium sp. CCBAU 53421 TaxID=1325120 RepID=UPI00188A22F4|nr:phosphonate C-P lyase system protein PhnH [Bradyrhizobium sp. CCBAU 53421]QOZ33239.1 phosphonate C-P lyase system protein PhnH [Bradyrhizobium sp. CCBAU 53421]